MTHTTHYGLKKPGDNDNALISDLNDNADLIDTALHEMITDEERAAWNGKLDRAGGTMKGAVTFPAGANPALMFNGPVATMARVYTDEDNSILFRSSVLDEENAMLAFIAKRGGTSVTHYLYGTHNKPTPADVGAAAIVTGSYVGTGTYGRDNPNILTLPVKPSILVVYAITTDRYIMFFDKGDGAERHAVSQYIGNQSSSVLYMFSGTEVRWYSDDSGDSRDIPKQLNESGESYQWVAVY